MICLTKMCAGRFQRVFAIDVTKMFHQAFFQGSFCLTNILFVAKSASQAVNYIGAVATEICTAFIFVACRTGSDMSRMLHKRTVSALSGGT